VFVVEASCGQLVLDLCAWNIIQAHYFVSQQVELKQTRHSFCVTTGAITV